MEGSSPYRNLSVALLSGGVGGARMARALATVIDPAELSIIVNVADDDVVHGVHVAADLDTVMYTLAGIEGPHGWGRAGDTWHVMGAMDGLGADTSFRLGDLDLATCLLRTGMLHAGVPLSVATARLSAAHGVDVALLPASDDAVRTKVQIDDGSWLDFQDYFVRRQHRDPVRAVRYDGADRATAAPGVVERIASADAVIIAPSNPPLSIWPILAVTEIRRAVEEAPVVLAVSPLFAGRALKGPAAEVLAGLELPNGTAGIIAAYEGVLTDLVVDESDARDIALASDDLRITAMNTRIGSGEDAARFGAAVIEVVEAARVR